MVAGSMKLSIDYSSVCFKQEVCLINPYQLHIFFFFVSLLYLSDIVLMCIIYLFFTIYITYVILEGSYIPS